jgi:hypothetical protein
MLEPPPPSEAPREAVHPALGHEMERSPGLAELLISPIQQGTLFRQQEGLLLDPGQEPLSFTRLEVVGHTLLLRPASTIQR